MTHTHGILMSSPMVKAYLAGLKTQTRRTFRLDAINANPDVWTFKGFQADTHQARFEHDAEGEVFITPPYGWIGDTLWFKETYAVLCKLAVPFYPCENEEEEKTNHYIEYRADTGHKYPGDWPEEEAHGNDEAPKWKPSMFMKRAYSRFVDIPILDVKVERVQEMTRNDAFAEGVRDVAAYEVLWDHLNGKKLPWSKNPWVWAYEFPIYPGKGNP